MPTPWRAAPLNSPGMLRFLTAGESHGPQLTVIVDGVPAGLPLTVRDFAGDLRRRQGGYGRGGRQKIERDEVAIVGGVRGGRTLGSPVALVVANRDWDNWQRPMQIEGTGFRPKRVTRVRPGHADLAGILKYGFDDARNVLERASARETAVRVAAGAVARRLLRAVGISVHSHVRRIGAEVIPLRIDWDEASVDASSVRCPDPQAAERMVAAIDAARSRGDTLGGTAVVAARGVMVGLGTYAQWDRRLDGRLAQAMCSIPSVKAVELGDGMAAAAALGSHVHDSPQWREGIGFTHLTNRQGGLTGGVTNGETVWCQVHFKPISTLLSPLSSVDIRTGAPINAHYERSDICVVPAGAVVAEAMMAWTIAEALLEKFGGDSMDDLRKAVAAFRRRIRRVLP